MASFSDFSFLSPSLLPPFLFVPTSMQTVIMCISFHATYSCITFLHPGWMQSSQFSPPFSFVIQAVALFFLIDSPTKAQSNENTTHCLWLIHLNPLPCANRCWRFLSIAVNGELYSYQHCNNMPHSLFLENAVIWCLNSLTKLWGFSENEQ